MSRPPAEAEAVRHSLPPSRPRNPDPKNFLESWMASIGQLLQFAAQAVRQVPLAVRLYPSEIFRHAGITIRSNAAVVLGTFALFGAIIGITAGQIFETIGAETYYPSAQAASALRGVGQVVFGWMLAAKVGCGIVAEIGAMRINDEVDAMEVMGIRSVPYLVSTRILATILVIPFLWFASIAVYYFSAFLMAVKTLNILSEGAYQYFLFLFQNTYDLTVGVIWAVFLAVVIIIVACYYGLSARGGPVDVGLKTAQSMLVNLVFISVIAAVLVQVFYGSNVNAPIGN